ncbi:MAG: hypothetical protein KAJ12_07535 [Bacteroidetes bacterium]|nr:hypothetical protein [Bacteroidota bacterium]
MKSFGVLILYCSILWLVPFVVAIGIFPLHTSNRPLFETIMPVVLTISVVLVSILYFRKVDSEYLRAGIRLGVAAFVVSFLIDLSLFSWGPMKMPFGEYVGDIGLTYLIYPTVTVGIGYLLMRKAVPASREVG